MIRKNLFDLWSRSRIIIKSLHCADENTYDKDGNLIRKYNKVLLLLSVLLVLVKEKKRDILP
jgi:hypothetical protein